MLRYERLELLYREGSPTVDALENAAKSVHREGRATIERVVLPTAAGDILIEYEERLHITTPTLMPDERANRVLERYASALEKAIRKRFQTLPGGAPERVKSALR